jgi:CobQ-like glutamine amidotransferase family enzyme
VLDKQCVELGEEVNPDKTAVIVLGGQEDVGNKVVTVDKPTTAKDVKDVENRVIDGLRHGCRGNSLRHRCGSLQQLSDSRQGWRR